MEGLSAKYTCHLPKLNLLPKLDSLMMDKAQGDAFEGVGSANKIVWIALGFFCGYFLVGLSKPLILTLLVGVGGFVIFAKVLGCCGKENPNNPPDVGSPASPKSWEWRDLTNWFPRPSREEHTRVGSRARPPVGPSSEGEHASVGSRERNPSYWDWASWFPRPSRGEDTPVGSREENPPQSQGRRTRVGVRNFS